MIDIKEFNEYAVKLYKGEKSLLDAKKHFLNDFYYFNSYYTALSSYARSLSQQFTRASYGQVAANAIASMQALIKTVDSLLVGLDREVELIKTHKYDYLMEVVDSNIDLVLKNAERFVAAAGYLTSTVNVLSQAIHQNTQRIINLNRYNSLDEVLTSSNPDIWLSEVEDVTKSSEALRTAVNAFKSTTIADIFNSTMIL